MTSDGTRKPRRINRRVLIIGSLIVAVVLVCGGGGIVAVNVMQNAGSNALGSQWETVPAEAGTIDASISATGNIESKSTSGLNFEATGNVIDVFVVQGEDTQEGTVLARIDDTDLQLQLENAKAELNRAQADYQKLLDGATPEEIAEAETQVASAQAGLDVTLGSVTNADIAAAQARLEEAQTTLAQLESGPKSETLRASESQVQEAESQLQSQRDSLSAAKTNAELALEQATTQLTQAQSSYAIAKGNWEFVQETGKDPANPDSTNFQTGEKEANKVNNTQRQQYYDTFVQAEASLRSAEASVEQAVVTYNEARQSEVTGIRSAEQTLQTAQADLDDVRAGAEPAEFASARAAVESARAELNKLTGSNRSGSIRQSETGVRSAQLALEQLLADPSASELATAEAAVVSAETNVKLAERDLAKAELKAPFTGTVAQVNITVGESSSSLPSGSTTTTSSLDGAAIVLADLSRLRITVSVDELDIAQVAIGQEVRITLDALPDIEIEGTVDQIAPLASVSEQGATTYAVDVEFDPGDAGVKPGMTASVQIVTNVKDDAVLVPRRAVEISAGETYVYVPSASGEPDSQTGRPASEQRQVEIGLSNAQFIEITDGLEADEEVLVQPVINTFNPADN
ncbi:MAG: efflux RND transporter periplasmic adaptor subunit [Chloroflexota bacterium]